MNLNIDPVSTEPIEVRVMRDVAHWADERAAIKATCRNEIGDLDEQLEPMSAEQQGLLVEELLGLQQGRRSTASTLRPYAVPGSPDDEQERDEGDDPDLLETIEQPVTPLLAANDGLGGWRRVASHIGAAATAAALTLWIVPADDSTTKASDSLGSYEQVDLTGLSSARSQADGGLCLDQEARVRITGAIPSPETLEVVFEAADESGATHWALHHPVTPGWSVEPDGIALRFEGPLRDIARLDPGAWSMTVQVGPRGSCGPKADPRCATLGAGTIRVTEPERC